MKKPNLIMIHHTGVSYQLNKNQFSANNAYHKRKWGVQSSLGYYLGYTYEISRDGFVMQARADGERTVACYQKQMNNGQCLHIALDGNFEIEKPYPNEIYALRDKLRQFSKSYNIKKENIFFHNQFSNTKCPGKNMDLNFIRSLIA